MKGAGGGGVSHMGGLGGAQRERVRAARRKDSVASMVLVRIVVRDLAKGWCDGGSVEKDVDPCAFVLLSLFFLALVMSHVASRADRCVHAQDVCGSSCI